MKGLFWYFQTLSVYSIFMHIILTLAGERLTWIKYNYYNYYYSVSVTVVLKWKIWIDLKLQLTVCVNCDSHGLYVKMDTTTMLHKVISEVSSWSFKSILGLLVLKIQDFFLFLSNWFCGLFGWSCFLWNCLQMCKGLRFTCFVSAVRWIST